MAKIMYNDRNYTAPGSGTGGSAVWGDIDGTLSNQTDLYEALEDKVEKEEGKGLSTNDFNDLFMDKLIGLPDFPHMSSSDVGKGVVIGSNVFGSPQIAIEPVVTEITSGAGEYDAGSINVVSGFSSTDVTLYLNHDSSKQAALVSGTNIKTINGNSVLGSGNIEISGGGTTVVANPTEIGSEVVLDRIQIGTDHYKIDYDGITEAVKDYVDNEILGGTA